MNTIKMIMVLSVTLLLHSCFDLGIYVSDFPLREPGHSSAGEQITGCWKKVPDGKEKTGVEAIEIIRFNQYEYVIRSRGEGDHSLLRTFITEISGRTFLNIQDLAEAETNFVFCEFLLSGKNELRLHFISDTLFKQKNPSGSKKLRQFIEKNMTNPELFKQDMKFSFVRECD